MDIINIIADIGAVITGLAAVWVVWLGHRLTNRQRSDTWLENLNKLQGVFWDDPDFIQVREWIALESQYRELSATIETRFLRPKQLTREEYKRIELLDKFFNFMIRVRLVDSQLDVKRNLWEELKFEWWIDAIVKRQRWELFMYYEHFFGETIIGALLKQPEDPNHRKELTEVRTTLLTKKT
jgi:hypothetical protein